MSDAIRFRLESGLVRLVRLLVRILPMSVVRALGRGIGRLVCAINAPRRRIALENLEYAFPARPQKELRTLTSSMFAHFGGLLLELIKFSTYSHEQMLAACEFEGLDRVRELQRQGKGILFFTGHFGYWEIHALVHALTTGPISLLARPLDNPSLHRMLEEIRTRTGNSLIYRQGAVRKMIRDLSSGKGIAVLIDQHLHSPEAIYVGFFQRPAATTSALAALALRMGSPVIPVFALPLPGGRYRFIYEHAVDPPRADTPDAVREFTQRCTDVLEMYVRRHPDLWMWMHRRWRDNVPTAHNVTPAAADSDAEADA